MSKGRLFLTSWTKGQLGNLMFAYASVFGIAKINGRNPLPQEPLPLTKIFNLSTESSIPTIEKQSWGVIRESKVLRFDNRTIVLPEEKNITLVGYFQSWKYFDGFKDEIRKEFRFKEKFRQQIRAAFVNNLGRYSESGRYVISIHVRRGDVLSDAERGIGNRLPDLKYYSKAMMTMIEKYPYCVFLVFSNGIDWCRNNIKPITILHYEMTSLLDTENASLVTLSDADGTHKVINMTKNNREKLFSDFYKKGSKQNGNGTVARLSVPIIFAQTSRDPAVDLGQLTLANHSIMSRGSFGWWGAWLAGGDVIYFKGWIAPGSRLATFYKPNDYFPPHWVGF